MLVLSRRVGERIMIGDDVEVVVLETRGDKVRLGFSAPLDVCIHRQEVRERIVNHRQGALERQAEVSLVG